MRKFVVVGTAAVLLFSGCYTLLKHPRIAAEDTASRFDHDTRVAPNDDCLRCHDQAHQYYNPTLPFSAYYRGRSQAWLYYYDTPWWVEPYYYGGSLVQQDSTLPSPRSFGRRRSAEDPQTGAAGVSPSGNSNSSPVARAAKGTDDNVSPPSQGEKTDTRRNERRSGNDDNDDKSKRRVKKKQGNN